MIVVGITFATAGFVKLNNGVNITPAIFLTGTSTYTPTSLTPQSGQNAVDL